MQKNHWRALDVRTKETMVLNILADTRQLYLDGDTGLLEYITATNTRQFQYMG